MSSHESYLNSIPKSRNMKDSSYEVSLQVLVNLGLFKGVGEMLKKGGYLFTYGPYAFNGSITAQSNIDFNATLKAENPSWGIHDVHRELELLAKANGIILDNKHDLPANNHFLVWRKK